MPGVFKLLSAGTSILIRGWRRRWTMTAARLMAVGVATLVTSVNASLAGQNSDLDANNSNFLFRSARGRRCWDKVIL